MAEKPQNRPVIVTGTEERAHPALQKLARACLTLARLRPGMSTSELQDVPNPPAGEATS